jgi:hypothetical protein
MSGSRIIVGQSAWTLTDDQDVAKVIEQIESALQNGTSLRLPLVDSAKNQVTVFINGRSVETVVVDLNADARPSQISGDPSTSDSSSTDPSSSDPSSS